MKTLTLFLGATTLCFLLLSSCRSSDEQMTISNLPAQILEDSGSNTNELDPDPPKDDPKDYDNWRMNNTRKK